MSVDKDEGASSIVYMQGPAASRAKLGRILVIDDEAQVRQVSKRFLERLGYEVEQAQNAYEGVALFAARRQAFAAVILDLKMPGKDGWQCLAELKVIRPQVPVVICSGYDPDAQQLDMSHRHVAFLAKPFRVDELATVLDNLLDRSGRRR